MNTSDFTSNFWNIYTAVIIVASFLGLAWLLISQNKTKKSKDGKVETMGHEWDGIEEYNNPLPRWWFYLFVITVLFGIAYLVLFPGFASFKGTKGWTSHSQYTAEMESARSTYQPLYDKLAAMPIEQMAKDPEAKVIGQNLFNTYCIQCHGSDAQGAKGFPNLTDHDWLWGGTPTDIRESILNGRTGVMLPYGGLDPFPEDSVKDVTHYIYSLNKNEEIRSRANPDRAAKGKAIYDQICFSCHQANGEGAVGLAPDQTDNIWLWGGAERDIMNTIMHGRINQMPSWKNFLVSNVNGKEDDSKLKILTAYVWGLGGGQPEEGVDTASASVDADQVVVGEDGIVKFYFASGSQNLAAGANDALATVVQGVQEGKKVVISGYHDATGDAEQNAELAKQRAFAVRDALLSLGVTEDQIELRKPESTEGDGSNAEARRVEVVLQ